MNRDTGERTFDNPRKLGIKKMVALSTQAKDFFEEKCGYVRGNPDDLPPERAAKLATSGRKSFVLVKELG